MLYKNELVFDDSTPEKAHDAPEGYGKGWPGLDPQGYSAVADEEFPAEWLIPRNEWQARIEERESRGLQLSQRMIKAGLPCKDQSSTNFCWCNGPVHTVEITRVLQNEPMVILSPASVACPITGFRNVGGWGTQALESIIKNGVVPVDQWPANAISKQYFTQANRDLAMKYRVAKWLAPQPRNLDQLISLLLRDVPSAVAYNWWGHEVTAYDAIWENGQIGVRDRNSWGMSYGHLGFFSVQGNKMLPDDIVAPLTTLVG